MIYFSLCYNSTSLGATLGGIPGFLFYYVSIGTSLGNTLGGLPGFLFVFAPLDLVSGVAVFLWVIYVLLVRSLDLF